MIKLRENEEAVSPVIGVILMVAITVILAAVIAAFVFGMGSNVQTTKTVAVTASLNNTQHLVVTVQGGNDVGQLLHLNLSVNGEERDCIFISNPTVGSSNVTTDEIKPGDHVIVVAVFNDKSEQVVLDKFY